MYSLTLTLPNLSLSLMHIFKLKKSTLISRVLHKMHKYRTRKERAAEMERRSQEQRLAEKQGYREDRLEWQKWEVGVSELYIESFVKQCPGCGDGIEVEDGGCYTVVCLCGQQFCFICNTPWKPGAVKDHEELCLLHPEYRLRGSMTL